jgi:hypothetical protein
LLDTYLTKRELAKRLRLSDRSIDRMMGHGSGPPFIRVTAGETRGRVIFSERAVAEWLEKRNRSSTSDTGAP